MTDPNPSDLTYAEALDELEAILRRLEADDLDVDRLADQVSQAHRLVQLCRSKIAGARLQVEQVLVELESPADLS